MHSRIFQLEKDVDNAIESPLTESDILGDWDEPGWFTTIIADYVSEETNREKDIAWFIDYLDRCKDYIKVETITDEKEQKTMYNSITFLEGFKQEYFKISFEAFKKYADELTLDDFCDGMTTYRIKMSIEDKYSFYIYGYDNGLCNLDSFVRDYLREEETYYFGNTLDYHF